MIRDNIEIGSRIKFLHNGSETEGEVASPIFYEVQYFINTLGHFEPEIIGFNLQVITLQGEGLEINDKQIINK